MGKVLIIQLHFVLILHPSQLEETLMRVERCSSGKAAAIVTRSTQPFICTSATTACGPGGVWGCVSRVQRLREGDWRRALSATMELPSVWVEDVVV